MTKDRVRDALEKAAARKNARGPKEQAHLDMLVLLATHLWLCTPLEITGPVNHVWRRDLQPPINGVGCKCKGVPMRVLGPEHFLRLLDERSAA